MKVVDFGISKSLRASTEEEAAQRLTQTGMVLGTPLYMSPEQARGDEDLDHRVDIYALGVIMYEAIAGRVPFAGTNYLSVISQVLNEEPKPLREIRPEVSEELESVIAKAMAKDRTQRYDDAEAMLKDLTSLLEDPTHSTERAKITGPRRRLPKAPTIPKMAWAIGGIGIAIGAVMLVVVLLMGGGNKKKRRRIRASRRSAATLPCRRAAPEPRRSRRSSSTSRPIRRAPTSFASPSDRQIADRSRAREEQQGSPRLGPARRLRRRRHRYQPARARGRQHREDEAEEAAEERAAAAASRPGAAGSGSAAVQHNAGGELTGYPGQK